MTDKTPKQRTNEDNFLDPNAKRLQRPYCNIFRSIMRGKKRGDGLVPNESRLEDLRNMDELSDDEALERYLLEKVKSEYGGSSSGPTSATMNFGRGESILDYKHSKRTLNKIGQLFDRMREDTTVEPEDVFLLKYGTEDRRARKKDILKYIEENVMV